ncbi:MarR family winged helix-turn-helix transcriptional regulator [Secundilactobacillus folii]|uniref:MarR family transcriptional regulator n=1 Tax=Secundilactobacillus folii TaxID=2678357 RepID=A0A7X2XW58_9LACO|nr:MarR family transcriptional regulator [Secundilactobacillus folii]MTV82721.1 MarR family transcriptional regulator [Secundilactobacillus folii]
MAETDGNSIAKWLVIAGRQVSQHLDRQLETLGVNASQYHYILKIHDNPGLLQKDLLATEFVNPSNVTRAIKQLVDRGIVVRKRLPTDKRAQQLRLTAKGAHLYPQIRAILDPEEAQIRETIQKRFPSFQPEGFVDALKTISRIHGDTDKQ